MGVSAVMMGAMTIGQMAPGFEALSKGRGAAYRIIETIRRVPEVSPHPLAELDGDESFASARVGKSLCAKNGTYEEPHFLLPCAVGKKTATARSEGNALCFLCWRELTPFLTPFRTPLQIDWEDTSGEALAHVRGEILFDNVGFYYVSRPEARVLPGLTLSVPSGQTAALVGSSGSGKSTVVLLLQRFYK